MVDLGEDYEYAVVSGPKRASLWILSRTPDMGEERYQHLLAGLRSRGFETDRLIRSPRESPASP